MLTLFVPTHEAAADEYLATRGSLLFQGDDRLGLYTKMRWQLWPPKLIGGNILQSVPTKELFDRGIEAARAVDPNVRQGFIDRSTWYLPSDAAAEAFLKAALPNRSETLQQLLKENKQLASEFTQNPIGNFFLTILKFLLNLIRWVLLSLAVIAGKMIDFLLGANFANAAEPGSPYILVRFWKFTRDALNFVFILSLLAIAFSIIAGLEGYGTRRMIPKLLFAALLVNFSLAISVAFVRLGDVLCTTALRALPNTTTAACGEGGQTAGRGVGQSLSLSLANASSLGALTVGTLNDQLDLVGLGRPLAEQAPQGVQQTPLEGEFTKHLGLFAADLVNLLILGVFVVAFIWLALMFFVRLIVLYVLLVLSPVPYAFSLIPQAAEYAKQWWTTFIKYVIFLPVTVFFLVLATHLMGEGGQQAPIFKELRLEQSLSVFTGNQAGETTPQILITVFQSLFTAIFIIIAIVIGQKLGIYGASGALAFAKGATLLLSGASPLWARTGAPFLAARKKEREEIAKERARTGTFAGLGRLTAAPLARTKAALGWPSARMQAVQRRQEDEEVKDLTARGASLDEVRPKLNRPAYARYALDKDLITTQPDFKTALGAVRLNSPEFNKGARKFQERYVVEGTDFVENARDPKKAVTPADYEKILRGLSATDAYEAYTRPGTALRSKITSGTMTPTRNLAIGIANAGDRPAAEELETVAKPGGAKQQPAVIEELQRRKMIP